MAKKKGASASPFVPVDEQPYPIPENWCWVRLGKLYEINPKVTADNAVLASFVPMERIESGMTGRFTFEIQSWEKARKNHTQFADGDVAFAKISPCFENQKSMIVQGLTNGIGGGTTELIILRQAHMNQKYTFLLISTEDFISQGKATYSGTVGQQRISMDFVKAYSVPVPPLPEQHRIVSRIESLFAKLDEAKEKAQAVVDGFELRKSAILHKAFTGELTEKWRKEHGVGLDSWVYSPWGNLIMSIEAGKNWSAEGRPPEDSEFGVVKVSAVTWGEFNELESKTCTLNEQWNEKTQIHEGDFLFSRANTLQLVGNCVIVKNIGRRLMLSDKILRFSFDKSVVPEYILYFTHSDLYRRQIEQLASGNQDGMRNVSQKNIKSVEFPVPLLFEQKEIVRIIGNLYDKEQRAKSAAEAVLTQIDTMKKSILARAFRGELGTNDPAEESAAELIKSICSN
ncbi:MAG: type I restriction endonuclease subunit S [Flavonifractor sp.]|jgi:type I restriction enzyme S subunit|nr:type I restriction endonuclease subunit S [Flavonifractor sp.]